MISKGVSDDIFQRLDGVSLSRVLCKNCWPSNRFSQHDRDRIVREFLSEGLNAKEVAHHYGLSGAQVLYQWLGRYIEETQIMRKTKELTDEEFKAMTPQEQLQELKRLKKALELEKIRSEAYNHMIELAEQQFNIPIRKKSGTKQ